MTERFQLHIALISAEYPPSPGGVGDYTRRLGQELVAQGQHVSVMTIVDATFQALRLEAAHAQQAVFRGGQPAGWGWQSWQQIASAIAHIRPDVVHVQYQTGAYGMHPAINLLPWRLHGLRRRPAVVVTAHDLLPPYLFPKAGPLRDWATWRILADADAAIVTNADDYAQLKKRRFSRRLECIPIGSNIAVAPPTGYNRVDWRARQGVRDNETLIAYFGLVSHTKGLDTLLDALEQLPVATKLLIIGGEAQAPQDHAFATMIRQRIAAGPLQQRVHITGHCGEAEVSAHLLAADLVALPFHDGASFRRGSLLAALAHGAPVVTTERRRSDARSLLGQPELPEFIDGEQALLVPPGDAVALAGAIQRLMADQGLREHIGHGGKELAAQFSWAAIVERHQALYRDLLGERPS